MVAPHQIQGTPEWLEYRRTRGGASELPALMRCSPWMPRTPLELYELKTGLREVAVNPAMRHGTKHEPAAREWMEGMIGEALEPQVIEAGRIVASLDGITMDGATIAELKVPPKGRESTTWQHIEAHGKPPVHYGWQVQQQLYVSQAQRCLFGVYDVEARQGITTEIVPDAEAHERLAAAWLEFFEYLDAGMPPPDDRPPLVQRDDEQWRVAAAFYRSAKRKLEAAQLEEQHAKERLRELAGDHCVDGCGVSFTHYYQRGSIDYRKAVPEGIDLEPFRRPGQWRTRIAEKKGAK